MVRLSFDRELLAGLRKKYPGKIVAFDSEYGCICVRKDVKTALAYAQKNGFPKPYIFDTASNKLIYLGYIPSSPFYDEPEWHNYITSTPFLQLHWQILPIH
jgi:hypothetical protein